MIEAVHARCAATATRSGVAAGRARSRRGSRPTATTETARRSRAGSRGSSSAAERRRRAGRDAVGPRRRGRAARRPTTSTPRQRRAAREAAPRASCEPRSSAPRASSRTRASSTRRRPRSSQAEREKLERYERELGGALSASAAVGDRRTLEDAERYLLGLELFGMRFGLDRMRRLMTALGSPQRALRARSTSWAPTASPRRRA